MVPKAFLASYKYPHSPLLPFPSFTTLITTTTTSYSLSLLILSLKTYIKTYHNYYHITTVLINIFIPLQLAPPVVCLETSVGCCCFSPKLIN
ncbi:hypothetical protein F8388_020581 [Cannabis sativa]|uniref:Uncharacterized protein n=1 Tax=Cannabis sativa TaxID=3483 RepID=A0A7J6ERI0_CANSA|nr:hypothetical protein F8388_020581 [Cannabis sativa]